MIMYIIGRIIFIKAVWRFCTQCFQNSKCSQWEAHMLPLMGPLGSAALSTIMGNMALQ